ncbi:2-oxoacid:acceptor oxidoreductase subunit alpha [bacterium]|nr:2-oxoacid:acceptor oxidoreductase subunit alpha [bacterium]
MGIDITVKIGGEAGQGIQTVGDVLAEVCRNAGFYSMAISDFESRIRGGHSFFQIRISDAPILAPASTVHLLVSLDGKTYNLYKNQLAEGGLVIVENEEVDDDRVLQLPIKNLANEAGGKVMANTVAAGAILSLLGAPFALFEDLLVKRFSAKSQEVVDNNIKAARLGADAVSDVEFQWAFKWENGSPKGVLINGAKAISLGALAGDCRFGAFYPMSPATSIMANLVSYTDDFPLVIEQVEDEIAAVNAVIGASYAGVRAMTSTSGGGFSLMVEGLGLAGIAEIPIVIVNAQRPGPATGLPTRTGQADLLFTIRASQDEFPRFVFAPSTPEDAYNITARAFHLAEKYQVPALVLTDQYLNDSLYIVEKPFTAPEKIERFIVTDDEISSPADYKRYALTESGISPRALPCKGKALVLSSGNEHTEDGHISEDQVNRVKMVDKRNAKLPAMTAEIQPPEGYFADADTLLVGWGSTKGAIREAVDMLKAKGLNVGCLTFTEVWPFPVDVVTPILEKVKRFLVVEQNSTAQFGSLIREQTGLKYSQAILKYDGRPLYPSEIVDQFNKKTE